ncbi:endochitinase-like [Ornithodoros turicata]|uniref:endochitinase-like n=1 Tax=Ornithodoros turicata TaxID=34597 RepID=UPI003138BD67
MNLVLQLACAAVALANFAGNAYAQSANVTSDLPVVCYYYGWANTRPHPMNYEPEDLPGDLCTHVNFAFAGVDAETFELKSEVPQYEANRALFKKFTSIKAKYPHLKTVLSIGGWQHNLRSFSPMVSSQATRQRFIRSLISWMDEYDFDGADMYWMYPAVPERGGAPTDRENYVQLLKEIREVFREKKLLLTLEIPILPKYLDPGYDVAELSKYVDWFNVHTFDLRGRWNGVTDVHSPLYSRSIDVGEFKTLNVKDGMEKLVARGAPKKKLLMGIPFLGRQFTLLDEAQHGLHAIINPSVTPNEGAFVRSSEVMGYYEICLLLRSSWVREFDTEGKCPYAYQKNMWVGYDDVDSIDYKTMFLIEAGYGGMHVFNVDLDDFRGICGATNPLLKAINARLRPSQNYVK